MTEQDTDRDDPEDIRRQFATLQAEMKRVMEEPATTGSSDPAADAPVGDDADSPRGSETDPRRRDADRLHARMLPDAMIQHGRADDGTETIAALRARIEDIGRRSEDRHARLARDVRENREAVEATAFRLDRLTKGRPSRWPVALAILVGAIVIAAAIVASVPGRARMLLNDVKALASPGGPHG